MCIQTDSAKDFKCGFFPGTGSCLKAIAGKKRKTCPERLTGESVQAKIEKSHDGHKICEGRPVNKAIIQKK